MSCAAKMDVVAQQAAVVGMRAVGDDGFGPLAGALAAQVRDAVFGDNDLHRMFAMIQVANHGHDGADLSALGRGRTDKDGEERVARKVARTCATDSPRGTLRLPTIAAGTDGGAEADAEADADEDTGGRASVAAASPSRAFSSGVSAKPVTTLDFEMACASARSWLGSRAASRRMAANAGVRGQMPVGVVERPRLELPLPITLRRRRNST